MRTVVDEIARGYATDTLRAELGAAEQRKRALVAELEDLSGRRAATASLDVERLRRELRRHVVEIRELLGRDIPRSRQILRRLLTGRLECDAFDEGTRRGYRVTGQGSSIHARQEVCSARCRAARSRQRKAEARRERDAGRQLDKPTSPGACARSSSGEPCR